MAQSRSIPLIESITFWFCPNCGKEDVTNEQRAHSRMHTCPKMGMLSAPMLLKGTKAKVYSVEREDYVGKDIVRLNDAGRPIMSIVTERENGQDAIVFAPTAVMRASDLK